MVSLGKQDSPETVLAEAQGGLLVKACATLFALGLGDAQVSTALDIPEARVKVVRALEETHDVVLRIQLALGMSAEQRIANAVNLALDVKMKALADESDKKHQQLVSTEILDRHMGKPVQTTASIAVTLKGNRSLPEINKNFSALLDRLQRLESRRQLLVNAPQSRKADEILELPPS